MKCHRSWKETTFKRYELETDEQYNDRMKLYAIKAIRHNKYLKQPDSSFHKSAINNLRRSL